MRTGATSRNGMSGQGGWALWPTAVVAMLALLVVMVASSTANAEEEHRHKNHASAFLGATLQEDGGAAFSVGVEYERRLTDIFGVGGFVEYAAPQTDAFLIGLVGAVHVWRGLKFTGGAGYERRHDSNHALVRVGAMYDFEIGTFTVSPTVDVDAVREERSLVIGLNLGKHF